MAIALDQTGSGSAFSGTTVTVTNFTATTGSVIHVSVLNSNMPTLTITAVSYNGGSFTKLYEADESGGANIGMSQWLSVTGADGSAHDMTVTVSADLSGNLAHVIVSSWTGVETSSVANAHRTIYHDGTGTEDLDVTVVDSQNNDVCLHAVANYGTDVGNGGAGYSTVVLATNILTTAHDHLVQYATATGASTAMVRTGGQFGSVCAFALVPGGSDVSTGLSGSASTAGRGTAVPGIEVPL